jgi:hypothetical protein
VLFHFQATAVLATAVPKGRPPRHHTPAPSAITVRSTRLSRSSVRVAGSRTSLDRTRVNCVPAATTVTTPPESWRSTTRSSVRRDTSVLQVSGLLGQVSAGILLSSRWVVWIRERLYWNKTVLGTVLELMLTGWNSIGSATLITCAIHVVMNESQRMFQICYSSSLDLALIITKRNLR